MTYKIVTKYIKDLSFEIPGAKSYFLLEKNIKDFAVNFDIKSQKINDNVIEVDTTLYLLSKKDKKFSPISICFSSLVNFEKKLEKEDLEKNIKQISLNYGKYERKSNTGFVKWWNNSSNNSIKTFTPPFF